MITYRYNQQIDPPGSFVLVNVSTGDGSQSVDQVPAQVDTGADLTVVPDSVVRQLRLASRGDMTISGFGADPEMRPTYLVQIQVHDLTAFKVEVLSDPTGSYILLGRDVLNHFRLVLDGPNQRLELD